MELKTKYITVDDINTYFGVNLASMMNGGLASANALIYRTEIRLESYLNATFYKNISTMFPTFSDYQKEHYKLALIEQVMYVIKNGDLSVDSGYDGNNGLVISRREMKTIIISDNAKQQLILCGLWNRCIGRGNEVYDRFIY